MKKLFLFILGILILINCSSNVDLPSGSNSVFCNGLQYDPAYYECANGEIVGSCRGEDYYPPYEQCVSGNITGKITSMESSSSSSEPSSSSIESSSSSIPLCGDTEYNPSKQSCLDDVLYAPCGNAGAYNTEEQVCIAGAIFAICESAGLYNTATQVCSEGKTYETVAIGTQVWMKKNLDVPVPPTLNSRGNSWCYDNQESNCGIYGRLYDWAAAMDLPKSCNSGSCSDKINSPHRGLCPKGFHIPTYSEWQLLFSAVGGPSVAGKNLKAASGWNDYKGVSSNGTDKYGFSALPAGLHYNGEAYTIGAGNSGFWWSAFESKGNGAITYYWDIDISYGNTINWDYDAKFHGFSVRCLKD